MPAIEPAAAAQLYDAREVLEAAAVRRAAEAPVRDLSRAEALVERSGTVAADSDSAPFLRLDVEFHRALNEVGGNLVLAELAEGVHRRIQGVRVSLSVYFPGRPAVAHRQHHELIAAVRAGDPDEAERVVRASTPTENQHASGAAPRRSGNQRSRKRKRDVGAARRSSDPTVVLCSASAHLGDEATTPADVVPPAGRPAGNVDWRRSIH